MTCKIYAVDPSGGQGIVFDGEHWYRISLDSAWQPQQLQDEGDAAKCALAGGYLAQEGIVGRLDDSSEVIRSMCIEYVQEVRDVAFEDILDYCPEYVLRKYGLEWSSVPLLAAMMASSIEGNIGLWEGARAILREMALSIMDQPQDEFLDVVIVVLMADVIDRKDAHEMLADRASVREIAARVWKGFPALDSSALFTPLNWSTTQSERIHPNLRSALQSLPPIEAFVAGMVFSGFSLKRISTELGANQEKLNAIWSRSLILLHRFLRP